MRCSKCTTEHNGRGYYCKPCKKQIDRDRYVSVRDQRLIQVRENAKLRKARLRDIADRAKSRPCEDCGEQHEPWVMQFDHLDSDTKVDDHREAGLAQGQGRDPLGGDRQVRSGVRQLPRTPHLHQAD